MCLCLGAKTSASPSFIFIWLSSSCCSNPTTLAVFSVYSYYSSPIDVPFLNMSIVTYFSCVHKAKNAVKVTDMGHYLDVSGLPPTKVRKHFHQMARAEKFYLSCETAVHHYYVFIHLFISFASPILVSPGQCALRERPASGGNGASGWCWQLRLFRCII